QQQVEGAAQTSGEYLSQAGQNLKTYADEQLEEVKEDLEPFTRHLPEPVQEFLNKGGWWVVFGVLGLLALLWLRSIVRRLVGAGTKHHKKKKHRAQSAPEILKERLKNLGEAYTEEGPRRLTVKGLPGRLRLVVLSQAGRNTGEL